MTAPLIATENADLAAANAGQLTAPQQANVTQYVQNSTNQLYQMLASEGVTNPQNDSRFIAGMQQIQQQVQVMTQNYIQQTFQQAMSAAGQASSNLTSAANMQTTADLAFTSAMSSAIGSIGGMWAMSNLKQVA